MNRRRQQPRVNEFKWEHIDNGFYEDLKTGKVLIVLSVGECYSGRVVIKKNRYKYYQYRQGKKVIDKYVGVVEKRGETK